MKKSTLFGIKASSDIWKSPEPINLTLEMMQETIKRLYEVAIENRNGYAEWVRAMHKKILDNIEKEKLSDEKE